MTRVTFDSNVWRKVASPSRFPKDPGIGIYQKINSACISGAITGFISETSFTLEQIKREDRLEWIKSAGKVSVTESVVAGGITKLHFSIGPNNAVVPVAVQMVKDHLEDAFSIGVRVLRSKRIAGPSSDLLKDQKFFLDYSSEDEFHCYNNKNGKIMRELENMGVGIANIKAKETFGGGHWVDVIKALPDSEKESVAELVAEWADADAVAASIAHDVSYFCTNDVAKSATSKGVVSALSPMKSQAITDRFGIQFVSPDDLCSALGL